MPEPLGYFTFVLHSHLPYVIGHGRWPHGMDWLNEAAAESYIPLLRVFNRLAAEGLTSGVTLGITPILASQSYFFMIGSVCCSALSPTRTSRDSVEIS